MKMKYKVMILAAALAGGIGMMSYAAGDVPQKSVLSGVAVSVVTPGTQVKEGDVLVTVETLAGPVPAARATVDGTVKEVHVQKGNQVEQNELVATISD